MAVTQYCTRSDVEDLLSAGTVRSLLDDDDDGVAEVSISRTLDRAALKINQYCQRHYTVAELAANDWVKHAAAVIAANFLFQRRANSPPGELEEEHEEILEFLREVYTGSCDLPGATPRGWDAPSMANLTIDGRYGQGKIRVQDRISLGDTMPSKNETERYLPDVPTVG